MPTRVLAACVAAFLTFVTVGWALAQAPQSPPTRIRGLDRRDRWQDGHHRNPRRRDAKVNLADNWAVALVVPIGMADIKENSFVGIASLKGADGNLNALEVLVFPENMRGAGEGHYPWDLQPESMMTNATVAKLASAPIGQTLTLTYKGGGNADHRGEAGHTDRDLPAGHPSRCSRSGAKLLVAATKGTDGSLSAARLAVGKGRVHAADVGVRRAVAAVGDGRLN